MHEKTDLTTEQGITGVGVQNIGVSRTSEVNDSEASLPEVSELHSISALLLVEQYVSLRNEVEKRIEIRQQILALTLLVAGTFLTVGVQPNVTELVLLFYPIIAMFLAAIWAHNDLRIGQLNFYIRTELEKYFGRFGPGWEAFRHQVFRPGHKRRKHKGLGNAQKHPLAPQPGLIVFSTRGIFLITEAIAIAIAAIRFVFMLLQPSTAVNMMEPIQVEINVVMGLLFIVDIAVLINTYYLVQHKRLI